MLEKTEDAPPVLQLLVFSNKKGEVLKVQVEEDRVFRDDLTGQLLTPSS